MAGVEVVVGSVNAVVDAVVIVGGTVNDGKLDTLVVAADDAVVVVAVVFIGRKLSDTDGVVLAAVVEGAPRVKAGVAVEETAVVAAVVVAVGNVNDGSA